MSPTFLLLVVIGLSISSYIFGKRRSIVIVGGNQHLLHSRPGYHGVYTALWATIPALTLLALWLAIEPIVLSSLLFESLPTSVQALPDDEYGLVKSTVTNLARSPEFATGITENYILAAAELYSQNVAFSHLLLSIATIVVAIVGGYIGHRLIAPGLRARNSVENVTKIILLGCSSVAVLTTIGIVLSMLSETIHFFSIIPPADFLFGTTWDPRFTFAGREGGGGGEGQYGMIPLMSGTILIATLAMLVATPIGLMSAVYLSEYAAPKVRAVVKPMLEILAGIPTVVYGFFALVTVGPFLRDLGDVTGLGIDARSALTAGLVMGVMIIPFISSLSDDVITAVPRALREGSLGLGATKSETVRKVVFPAAIPGIVGGILLAVSRAIGETMIVVMAAGVAANLTANPFAPVTTVTVKIVSQLTGDQEFNSPQTLVAFALGMTLFVVTLGLNVYALHIVRKYREQYD